MNKKAIYLDTNFIIAKQSESTITIVEELRRKGFDVFVTQMVIEEVKANNRREIAKKIDALKLISKSKLCKLYFPLEEAISFINLEEIYHTSDKRCDVFFHALFKDCIINNLDTEDLLSNLIERDMKKAPPFADGDSDKGWKDTIIWLAIMGFSSKNRYEDYYFITDDGFNKKSAQMAIEFRDAVGKDIVFVSFKDEKLMFRTLGIIEAEKQTLIDGAPFTQAEISPLSKDDVSRIKNAIHNFATTDVEYNEFGDTYRRNVFEFYEYVSKHQIEEFLDALSNDAYLFTFFDFVDIDGYFTKLNINAKTVNAIPLDSFNDMVDCWIDIKSNHQEYKEQFLAKIKQDFDSMFIEKEPGTDDLPF